MRYFHRSLLLLLGLVVSSSQIQSGDGFQQQQSSVATTRLPRRDRPLLRNHDFHRPLPMSSTAADDWYCQQQQAYRSSGSNTAAVTEQSASEQQQQQQQQQQQRILKDFAVPTTKQILQFAIPAVSIWLCIPLLSMMDTSCVGSIAGTTQLAALNPAIAVMNYSSKLLSFLFSGTTAIMAAAMSKDLQQQYRDSDENAAETTAKSSLLGILQFSMWIGAGLGALLFLFAKPLLLALIGGGKGSAADPFIMSTAMKYVKIRALGMPAAAMLGSAQTACLAQGDAKMPLYTTVVAAAANLLLDVTLIRHSHAWIGGAAGAAWGTSIAQILAAGWVMKWLLSSKNQQQSTKSTRGFLAGNTSFKDILRIPAKRISKGFAPFVFPCTTTQAGRSSASATIDHVVSSSMSTASMAANQIITSVYYGLIPIVESLSLAAQAFVPKITERGKNDVLSRQQYQTLQQEKSFAMRKLLTNLAKAAGVCGLIVGGIMGTLPLYSSVFSGDIAVQKIVANVVPLIFLTSLKHGVFCASEGILLGQKDLKFLGGQYAVYTFLIPYILLQVKQAALNGSKSIGLASVWRIFVAYDIFRTLVQMGRIAWLERKRSRSTI